MRGGLLLAGAIVAEVIGTLALRASVAHLGWIAVVVLYLVAFLLLGLTLAAGMPVAIAYGVWSAVGITVVAIAARVIWQEVLTRRMMLGIALIVIGVLLVEFA